MPTHKNGDYLIKQTVFFQKSLSSSRYGGRSEPMDVQ